MLQDIRYAARTRRLGRDPGVIGKLIGANAVPVSVVGVLSADFNGIPRVVGPAPDLSVSTAGARRVDRPVRADVLQRRAPHQRDRPAHGARRRGMSRAQLSGAPLLLGAPLLALTLFFAGCDEDAPEPPGTPPPGGVERITGNERLGWEQRAATAADLAEIRYNIYVDHAAGIEMQDVQCADTPGAGGFPCSGRLPPMSPGQHTLAVTSFVDAATGRLESARSATLTVRVGQASQPSAPPSTSFTTTDGVRLRAVAVATGLADPADLAIAPDGRIFIAERGGSIRIVRDGARLPAAAVAFDDLDASARRGLLAIALDPEFEQTGHVYAIYTTASDFRLVRLRHAAGTFGDMIRLLDGVAAPLASPAAALRAGPDGKLYLALDSAGSPWASGDAGSYSGKVLRLNRDGTTPGDRAGSLPVFASGLTAPRGLDWNRGSAEAPLLWVTEDGAAGTERLLGFASQAAPRSNAAVLHYTLPLHTGPAGLAFYRGGLIPAFEGDLLVAAADRAALLRLRFDPSDATKIVASERLLDGTLGPITAVAVAPAGAIYFSAGETLYLLVPEPARPTPR